MNSDHGAVNAAHRRLRWERQPTPEDSLNTDGEDLVLFSEVNVEPAAVVEQLGMLLGLVTRLKPKGTSNIDHGLRHLRRLTVMPPVPRGRSGGPVRSDFGVEHLGLLVGRQITVHQDITGPRRVLPHA
jgi:hypothetical protein